MLCAGRKGKAHLLAFSPQQGKSLWTRPLAGDPRPAIPSAFDCAVVASSGKVVAARLSDGTLRFETGLPFPGDAELACAEEDDARATLLLATGPGGACARIGERGNIAWSLPAEGTAPSPPARIARRLALILQGAPVVLDAQEGFALARIGDRPVRCAALADDGSVAICEESGALSLARLATHLSIVTT